MEKEIDMQALSAAVAGFLACHILTCRFLVQEGVIDKDRFAAYLETAMTEMAPGIEDQRTLFSLRQLIQAVRAPSPRRACSSEIEASAQCPQPPRTRDRAPDPAARAPPRLGPRSARRAALFLIKKREQIVAPLATAMQTALEKIEVCAYAATSTRRIHARLHRCAARSRIIVVVADVAVSGRSSGRMRSMRVITCSAARSRRSTASARRTSRSMRWSPARTCAVTVILALNATVDRQTVHYITDLLQDANVKVTRLAHGVPVGGELDYLDEGTLAAAIRQRTTF